MAAKNNLVHETELNRLITTHAESKRTVLQLNCKGITAEIQLKRHCITTEKRMNGN